MTIAFAPAALFDQIVAALRAMDAEAQPINGTPTGLNWYGGWARRDLKLPHTEVEWTRALAQRLTCRREVAYPANARKRCDLVADGCWIEVKGLWPAYWEATDLRGVPVRPAQAVPKARQGPHRRSGSHQAAGLSATDAPAVGLVLIGFDTVAAPCDADVDEFARLAGLSGWWHGHAAWPDAQRPGEAVKVWSWFEARACVTALL